MYIWLVRNCQGRSPSSFISGFVFQVISENTLCGRGFSSSLKIRKLENNLYENNVNFDS